jgi:hypothetical protein
MKKFLLCIVPFILLIALTSCIKVYYPDSGLSDVIAESENSLTNPPDVTSAPETAPITEEVQTEPITNAPEVSEDEVTETEKLPEAEDTSAEETTAKEAETEETSTGDEQSIWLVDITSPITPNHTATLTVRGKPNTKYSIKVFYSTTESKAKGLESKTSDEYGLVSWDWKIGGSVKTGSYSITVSGGGDSFNTSIFVE